VNGRRDPSDPGLGSLIRSAAGLRPLDVGVVLLGAILAFCWTLFRRAGAPTQVDLGFAIATLSCVFFLGARVTAWLVIDGVLVRGLRKQPSSLLRLIVVGLVYGGAGATFLYAGLNVDVTSLLATSAVLTAVMGFALQATLDNFFAGVALELEQPFHLGDVLRIDGWEGRVTTQTWRSVHLTLEDGERVVLPNGQLGQMAFEVLRPEAPGVRELLVEAPFDAPPGRVQDLLERIIPDIPGLASRPVTEVMVAGRHDRRGTRLFRYEYFPEDPLLCDEPEAALHSRTWYQLRRFGLLPDPDPAATRARVREALGQGALADLPGDLLDAFAQSARVAPFTAGERLSTGLDAQPALYLLVTGRLLTWLPPGATLDQDDERPSRARRAAWEETRLERVRTRLVEHLGPAAEVVIERAAHRTLDPHRLFALAAETIDSPEARAEFLSKGPRRRSAESMPGALFGEASLVGGPVVPLRCFRAVSEAEVAWLPAATLATLARERGAEAAFTDQIQRSIDERPWLLPRAGAC
jgi:small-conductance mechanosensitive channel